MEKISVITQKNVKNDLTNKKEKTHTKVAGAGSG